MPNLSHTVLVVDDDRNLLTLMGHVLQKHGYQTLLADSADQVWQKLDALPEGQAPHLILLDLMLPGVSGLDLYHAFRRRPQTADLPVIILSAVNDIDKRVELLNQGVDDYLVKPCPLDELMARVAMYIKLAELHRAKQAAERRSQTQARYLQSINEIGYEATQYLDLEVMLSKVATDICTQFECANIGFFLQNPENEQETELTLVARCATRDAHMPPLVWQTAVDQHTHTEPQQLYIPILRGQTTLGVLHVTEHDHSQWDNTDKRNALEVLTRQLATAITNAYLFQDIRRHNQKLQVVANENSLLLHREQRRRKQAEQLHHMAQILSSSLELTTVLDTALATVHSMVEVEDGSIILVDEAKEELYFAATLNHQPWMQTLRLQLGQGVVGMVIAQQEGLVVNDVVNHPNYYSAIDDLTGVRTRSLLCVPLTAHGRILGALELINKTNGDFTGTDLALVSTAAGSIAIAVDNARLYEAQETAHKQLLQTEKLAAAGRLAASMAHEINNPLQAVHSCLQLLIQFDLAADKKEAYLNMAGEEVERLINITNRILDFSRPSTGTYERVSLQRILNQVMQLAQKHIVHQKVKVQQTIAVEVVQVWAVPDQIAQVFLNIILNSLDAMPTGGQLDIQTTIEGEWVSTLFRDTGIGMDSEVQTHLFEPFYSTKSNQAGLGLTISHGIVERHGGQIHITSQQGVGTTVNVLLPRPLEQ